MTTQRKRLRATTALSAALIVAGGWTGAIAVQTTNPTSLNLQRRFAAAVPGVVVGKPIGEVKVGRLAGSSGTPVGFNDALEKIKQQASN